RVGPSTGGRLMTAPSEPQITVSDRPDEGAYVIEADGQREGKAEYAVKDGRGVVTHTEVDDASSGRCLATKPARFALDDVKAKGVKIAPRCPFIAAYVKRHPEYQGMVDTD